MDRLADTRPNPVYWYLLTTLLTTCSLALLVAHSPVGHQWLRLGVLFPSVLALIFVSKSNDSGRFGRQFLLGRSSTIWLPLSFAFFFLLAVLAAAIVTAMSGANALTLGHVPPVDRVLFLLFLAMGEEVGWRGYGLPLLAERVGWLGASLILGAVWWLWHLPGWTLGFGAPTDVHILVFGVWVISASVVFTAFYLTSGNSVWTAVFLHGGANLALQVVPVIPDITGTPWTFALLTGVTVASAIVAGGLMRLRPIPTGRLS